MARNRQNEITGREPVLPRRRLLASVGGAAAVGLAGCSGGDDGASGGDGESDETTSPGEGGSEATTEPGGSEPTETGTADIVAVESELKRWEDHGDVHPYVDFVAENQGEAESGLAIIRVEFLDADGNTVGEGDETVGFLDVGTTWNSWVTPAGADPEVEVDSFELTIEVESPVDPLPNLSVTEMNFDREDDYDKEKVILWGLVENTGDTTYENIQADVNLLNDQGEVISYALDEIRNIEPGEEPRFITEHSFYDVREVEPADGDIVFTEQRG